MKKPIIENAPEPEPDVEQPYSDEVDRKIRKALKEKGASNANEVCLETGIEYDKVLEWFAFGENAKKAYRLSMTLLWDAKKKVMKAEGEEKWLLTHHKDSKRDWSDRVEYTGAGGTELNPVSPEKKKEIDDALDKM